MENALSVRTPDWNGYGVTNEDKPEKSKRGPVMNALSAAFKFGAPEAYEQGRQNRLRGQLGEALKSDDLGTAGNLMIDMGQYDAGMKMRDAQQSRAGEASTQKAQQLMSLTENLMQIPEDRRGQYLMENWQQFEPIVGTDFMTHWQKTGGDVSDASLDEDLAMLRTQLGVGVPESGKPMVVADGSALVGPDGVPLYENAKDVKPGFERVTTDQGIFQYDPANPKETMTLLGQTPEKSPLVNFNLPNPNGAPSPYANYPDGTMIDSPPGTRDLGDGRYWVVEDGQPVVKNAPNSPAAAEADAAAGKEEMKNGNRTVGSMISSYATLYKNNAIPSIQRGESGNNAAALWSMSPMGKAQDVLGSDFGGNSENFAARDQLSGLRMGALMNMISMSDVSAKAMDSDAEMKAWLSAIEGDMYESALLKLHVLDMAYGNGTELDKALSDGVIDESTYKYVQEQVRNDPGIQSKLAKSQLLARVDRAVGNGNLTEDEARELLTLEGWAIDQGAWDGWQAGASQ